MAASYDTLNQVFLKKLRNKNKGAVSAVFFNGEEIMFSFYDGLINKEKKLPPKDDSLFMIGSNTKVLTSLGLFRLIEDGKLSLDDPITKFIPEFSVQSRMGDYPVTVENLLMHRGGIQCDLYPFIIGTNHTYTDIIPALKETYRTSVPGTMFSYSNLGYTLLGIVLERCGGKPYVQFLHDELFTPLDMEVYFCVEDDLPADVADRVAHSFDKKGKRTKDPLGTLLPAGSNTYTKITDLVKIGQLLMNDGRVGDVHLYKPETIQLMKTLKIGDELDKDLVCGGYGLLHHALSLDYETGRILGHGGNTMNHHSVFNFLPDEKIGFIAFANFENAPMLERKLETEMFNEFLKEEGFKKKEKKEVLVKFDAKDYVRRYDTAAGQLDFKANDKGELTAKISKLPITLQLDSEGWLVAKPGAVWTKLPPIAKQLDGMKFREAEYFGKKVLLMQQRGVTSAIGEIYYEPQVNHAWLKALGTYKPEEKQYKDLFQKAVLAVKDGDLILTLYVEGEKMDLALSVINDNEAVIKGFGRNMKETVFLSEKAGKFTLTAVGVDISRVSTK